MYGFVITHFPFLRLWLVVILKVKDQEQSFRYTFILGGIF